LPDDLGTVFISYTHDSADHAQAVLNLSNRLRFEGIDCVLDRYVSSPPEGWPQWMDREITKAQFVLMICTEAYNRRVMGQETAGKGLGIAWEGHLIYNHIYSAASRNKKFIPVIFDEASVIHIPTPLQGATRYCLSVPEGYDGLYTRLIGLPPTEKPPLGKRRALPPREVKTTFGVESHVQSPMNATLEMVVNRSSPDEKIATRIDDAFANQATQFLFTHDPYHRPPLDITPSSVTKMFPLRGIVKVSFGVLSFVSVILTILGENIFQLKHYLPESVIRDVWTLGIGLLILAIFVLVFMLILKIAGSIRSLSGAWVVVDKGIVHIQFRRVCPFSECGGVMEPKNIKDVGPRWVCRRNPRSHLIEYDHTQIASAMNKGQLNSKIKTVMGESYRGSRRRARQVQRADFP
jgi:hypothetical protein